ARGAPGVLVAAAGAEVLGDLFPSATARVAHELDAAVEGAAARGASTGAIASARALGRAAGRAPVRHAHRDGSNRLFTGASPTGECAWTGTNPLLPMAGTWSTWITTSGAEFQPEPPFPCGSAEDLAEVAEVVAVASARTAEQIAIVHKWADHSPPALWNDRMDAQILDANLDAKTAARLQAYVNMAMYDAFVSCWRTKYTYWAARPVMRSPGLSTVVPTPNFPSYTSGHATISAAAASVLAEAFPALADDFRAEAQEAAQSRLWGGIHFRHDNEQGLLVGARIGEKVALRMRAEAARAGEGDAALVAAVR
ncbi:MAG: phosphatase PAP2 family protein, partial [Candidatus Eisenbacteria bacterium]